MTNSHHGELGTFGMLASASAFLLIGCFNIWIGRKLGMRSKDGTFEQKFMFGTLPRLAMFGGVCALFLSFWIFLRLILGR